ncbi:MAG: hypothetical protein KAT65_14580 [Methanophagales archaeon]|nr:hypothetical protein [Methanophagales archaeon]
MCIDKYSYLYKEFLKFLREFEIEFLAIPEEGIVNPKVNYGGDVKE